MAPPQRIDTMHRLTPFTRYLQRPRQPGDLVFALAFVAVSALLCALLPWQVTWIPRVAVTAQPALWPAIGVFMMLGFGLLHLGSNAVSPRVPGRGVEVRLWARSLEYVVWFIAYVLVVPLIGYLPTTMIVALLLSLRLGYRRPAFLVGAVVFGAAVVLVFKTGLGVRIPGGALYAYLPDSLRSFALSRL